MTSSVIIIDDDMDTVEVFCEYLSLKDVRVLGHGYDGKKAVELYKEHKPDVVIVDLHMPKFDGFYAIREIKKIEPECKIIVVLDTEFSDEESKRLIGLGVNAVLYKPYEIDSVVQSIEDVKRGKGMNCIFDGQGE
jgi:DNA-binding NarL/FixJ family response regulator